MKLEIVSRYLRNSHYRFSASSLFCFFAAWAIWWSFYAIWLEKSIDLNAQQTGDIYAINSAVSLIFMFIYGIVQDKLHLKKSLLFVQAGSLMILAPFVIYIYEPMLKDTSTFYLGAVLGAIVISVGFLSGCPLLESFNERISRYFKFQYGAARSFGSLGYAATAAIAGICFAINPYINFILASCIGCLYFVLIFSYKPNATTSTHPHKASIPSFLEIISVVKGLSFWKFAIFVVGTFSFYGIYDQQMFPKFYVSLFENRGTGEVVYGYLNSFQVFLEFVFLFLLPPFIDKIGAKKALLLAAFVMVCRIGLSGAVENVYLISLIKLLHGIEIPLFILSMFKYINANFDSRISSTMYLIGFNVASNVGVIVLSAQLGKILDKYNYSATFFSMAAIVLFFTLISIFTLSNKKPVDHLLQSE